VNHTTPVIFAALVAAAALAAGVYATSTQAAFADSINLKQENKQKAKCLALVISRADACNQDARNEFNVDGPEEMATTPEPTTRPAHLTVIKHVINDDGGIRDAGDFTISVDSDDFISPFPGAESPGTTITLNPGSYSVSETGPAGYTQSLSGDCSGTIGSSESRTCTITNNDNPQTSGTVLIKKVVNCSGNGCPEPSAFTITVSGSNNPTPSSFAGSGTGTLVTAEPGTVTVAEAKIPPLTVSFSGDCSSSGTVQIVAGQQKSCIVTNAGTIELQCIPPTVGGIPAQLTGTSCAATGPTNVITGAVCNTIPNSVRTVSGGQNPQATCTFPAT
jgi:hypothetical protein